MSALPFIVWYLENLKIRNVSYIVVKFFTKHKFDEIESKMNF